MSDGEQIRSWLQNEVKGHWDATNGALLLSKVGMSLRRQFPDFVAQIPNGLKDYLMRWPVAQVVQHPLITQKIGLVPLSVKLPEDLSEVFENSRSKSEHAPYLNSFWRAFTQPINGRRFVYLDPAGAGRVDVRDFEAPALPSASGFEILESDLGPLNADLPPEKKGVMTHQKIRDWLSRNNIPQDSVLRSEGARIGSEHNVAEKIGGAILGLSLEDQARIVVPLDVVLKLIKKMQ